MPDEPASTPPPRLRERVTRGQSLGTWLVEFTKFLGVGGIAYVVDVGLFNLLVYGPGPLDDSPSAVLAGKTISAAVAILVAWIGNRTWTFRAGRNARAGRELVAFVLVNLLALGVTVGTLALAMALGVRSAVGVNIAGNIVGVGLGTLVRYVLYRYVVFTGDGDAARR